MNRMTIASSLMSLALLLAGSSAFAADEMKKETMAKHCAKDAMGKDCMDKDGMKKDAMTKDGMKKDTMSKDAMGKDTMKKQ